MERGHSPASCGRHSGHVPDSMLLISGERERRPGKAPTRRPSKAMQERSPSGRYGDITPSDAQPTPPESSTREGEAPVPESEGIPFSPRKSCQRPGWQHPNTNGTRTQGSATATKASLNSSNDPIVTTQHKRKRLHFDVVQWRLALSICPESEGHDD